MADKKPKALVKSTLPDKSKWLASGKDQRLVKGEMIVIGVIILAFTIINVHFFKKVYQKIESFEFEQRVSWKNGHNYELAASPSWYWNKVESKELIAVQSINDSAKIDLLNLYSADSLGYAVYKDAVDELTYKTNKASSSLSYIWTLLLGSLAAMLGVQLRTTYRFIDRVCYVKNLNAWIWWPWYVFRPLEAFIIGALVILLAEVDLLNIEVSHASNLFWIGLAALAGFGSPDVIKRVKMLSKTLFGFNETGDSHRGKEPSPAEPAADPLPSA